MPDAGISQKGPTKVADPCHKAPVRASTGGPGAAHKIRHNLIAAPASAFNRINSGPIRFHLPGERGPRRDRRLHERLAEHMMYSAGSEAARPFGGVMPSAKRARQRVHDEG